MKPQSILILTAIDQEYQDALGQGNFEQVAIGKTKIPVHYSSQGTKNIYFAKTGIGPINSSFVTGLLLQEFSIDHVLLLGLGGAVDSKLRVGDICIASHIIQHDAICSFDNRLEQMACGEPHLSITPSDRASIKIATSSEMNEHLAKYLVAQGFQVHSGDILSGSEFCGSHERKQILKERFKNSMMVEMEASGVAYICNKHRVPFSVIKTVSDTVAKEATTEYLDYLSSNAKKCTNICVSVVNENFQSVCTRC